MGGKETMMGPALSQKPSHGLMQNCDLPPPLKVFEGPNKAVFSPTNRICNMTTREEDENEFQLSTTYGFSDEKLDLLKALRLSQTRAREAERKAAVLIKERDTISNALMEESTRLFAYRQWVRLLEVQVSNLQRQEREEPLLNKEDDSEGAGSLTLIVALAFCLGIAGVSFVFGYKYLYRGVKL